MKVLYDLAAFTMQPLGGVSRVMFELFLHGLKRPDVDCRFPVGAHKNLYLQNYKGQPEVSTGTYIPPPWAKQIWMNPVNNICCSIYSQRFRPDICHYTFLEVPSVPCSTKTVLTVHDLITDIYPEILGKRDRQSEKRRRALAFVDGVVCVSENTRKDLLAFYPQLNPSRVHVAHNGNDLQSVSPKKNTYEHPFILYVGSRAASYKNFSFVLQTIRQQQKLDEFHLICFGGGAFSPQERRLIKDLALDSRVVQISGDDAVLAGFYRSAFALIYPSKYEGFGLPPIEAMSCGCPVVASSAQPMPEIIGEEGLFFDPSDSEICASHFASLKNPTFRRRHIEYGIARSRYFSWEKTAASVYNFYDRLLGS